MTTLQTTTAWLRLRRDDGQDLIEYALLTALIAIVAFTALAEVGSVVLNVFWAVIATSLP